MKLESKKFGLPASTVLEELADDQITIVIDRKSRIIIADGRKILEKADKIKAIRPSATVRLRTTAPVCSKTKKYLEDAGVQVVLGAEP